MHLAAAVNIPCVAIFSGRDAPGAWEPWGQSHRVLRHHVDCEGCMLDQDCPNKLSLPQKHFPQEAITAAKNS
jgi:ADP-heptose:LPS heptosyltransferase